MDAVTEGQMQEVEESITQQMSAKGLLSSHLLFYDLTNFFTYIASDNEASYLAKRGRNKQKRCDLRQFGLALIVTQEFLLPVLNDIYEGN